MIGLDVGDVFESLILKHIIMDERERLERERQGEIVVK